MTTEKYDYIKDIENHPMTINGKTVRMQRTETWTFKNKEEAGIYMRRIKRIRKINECVAYTLLGCTLTLLVLWAIGLNMAIPLIFCGIGIAVCLKVDDWCS